MGAAASGEITTDFGDRTGSGLLVTDLVSGVGVDSSTPGSGLLCVSVCGVLDVPVVFSGNFGPGRPVANSSCFKVRLDG